MSNANIFLIVNLGCEMLYVIYERLKAQCVSMEKSAQVIRDLTSVLLDPRFLIQLMNASEHTLLSPNQCRILLTDIACCSLMKLDKFSMDKLWDLIVIVYKWQINTAKDYKEILEITFKHIDGIGKIIPEMRKTILIDCAKKTILTFWNRFHEEDKIIIRHKLVKWLKTFNVKISILLRLGFQKSDGKFEENLNSEYYQSYILNLGENIYSKGIIEKLDEKYPTTSVPIPIPIRSHEIDRFVDQLNIPMQQNTIISTNIILDEIHLQSDNLNDTDELERSSPQKHQFVRINNITTIDNLLEKLNFSNEIENKIDELDITEQLLGMLDEEN